MPTYVRNGEDGAETERTVTEPGSYADTELAALAATEGSGWAVHFDQATEDAPEPSRGTPDGVAPGADPAPEQTPAGRPPARAARKAEGDSTDG